MRARRGLCCDALRCALWMHHRTISVEAVSRARTTSRPQPAECPPAAPSIVSRESPRPPGADARHRSRSALSQRSATEVADMVEEGRGAHDSVELVYGLAQAAYRHQQRPRVSGRMVSTTSTWGSPRARWCTTSRWSPTTARISDASAACGSTICALRLAAEPRCLRSARPAEGLVQSQPLDRFQPLLDPARPDESTELIRAPAILAFELAQAIFDTSAAPRPRCRTRRSVPCAASELPPP